MLYVIGGDASQAQGYIEANKLHGFAFVVDRPEDLASMHQPDVILVGAFSAREDKQHFETVLLLVGADIAHG